MKKIITLMAIVAMSAMIMVSCSGSGSKNPFGSLPEKCEEFKQESDKLREAMENVKSEAEKAELMKKHEELVKSMATKIEKSAKALDGKILALAENEMVTVTEPLSFQFDDFFSKNDLEPMIKVNGKAEAATDIATGRYIGAYIKNTYQGVYLVGYNAEGKEVYTIKVGNIDAENRDNNAFIVAGTPVKFDTFVFGLTSQKCKDAKTMKLEIR